MKVLVTGGGGFLGQAVCRMLTARGDQVRTLNRHRYPALDALGVEQRLGDIRDARAVHSAVEGQEGVVHCAALVSAWGPARDFDTTNIGGTRNVLAACVRAGVPRLVHTSSPSVVHDGRDLEGVDESVPYARRFLAHYPRTKAAAEQLVLAADGDRLATVALRPHTIWGPGDALFVPKLTKAARRGLLRLPRTPGKQIDTVYIDNAAEAHLLALDRLSSTAPVAGRAYFITQDQPCTLASWVNALLDAAQAPPVTPRVPVRVAQLAAAALEGACALPGVRAEPPLTRYLVAMATTSHWFDISAARRDLDYTPRVTTAAGMQRLAAHLTGPTAKADL
ncbi:NAD-dependent epimerase/dehydratase family protein [Spirillospora sp. CA-253888]